MKRDAVKKEQEKKDMEDVVVQDKLVEIRSKVPRRFAASDDSRLTQLQIDARPCWIVSSYGQLWKASAYLASWRSIRTVFATSLH
jgi:hypothetical protein